MAVSEPTTLEELVRTEMRNVISELSMNPSLRQRKGTRGDMAGLTEDGSDGVAVLKERIALLEDVLAKSEADRASMYSKYEQLSRQLSSLNEEKLALIHEFHDTNHGPLAEMSNLLNSAREENTKLRTQLLQATERYEGDVPRMKQRIRELEVENKKMRRQVAHRARDDIVDGVTLADLHYSNERLSAQLAKVQGPPPPPLFDDAKFRECEHAISVLSAEVGNLEGKISRINAAHAKEKHELQSLIEKQYHDFGMERAECDRVVGIMTAKIESLLSENNLMRAQRGYAPREVGSTRFSTPKRYSLMSKGTSPL